MRVGSGGRRRGNQIGRAAGSPVVGIGVDINVGCGGGVGVGADAMWQPTWVRVRT